MEVDQSAKAEDASPRGEPYESSLLECLLLVAHFEGRPTSRPAVTAGLPLENGELTPETFVRAANRSGLAARLLHRDLGDIPEDVLPAIIGLDNGSYAVLTDLDRELDAAVLTAPEDRSGHQLGMEALRARYTGEIYYLRPMQAFDRRTPKLFRKQGQHWFWSVIKSSWSIYRDVLIASFFINLFVLAYPLFIMNVYDRVVPNGAMETLWALAAGVFIVYVFDFVLKALRSYFVELAAKRSDVILSSILFERVMGLKMQYRPVSIGAFANRLQEFESIRSFITSTCVLAIVDFPFLLLFVGFIAWIGGWLAVVPLTAIPLAILLGVRAQRRLRPMIENVMAGSARKNATLVESMAGVDTLKTLGAEGRVQRTWEQAVGYVSQWGLQARRVANNTLFAVQSLQQLSMVAIVIWGVYLISDQALTLGGLIACVILSSRALAPLGQVASLIAQYDHAEATLKSLTEIMESPVEREEGKRYLHRPRIRGDIRFKQVGFAYDEQSAAVLEDLNLNIASGEKVGIIGQVGSGKTTLAKLLMRLYEPSRGAVQVDGFDIQQLDPADLRAGIGYVSQDVTLFYGTLRENLTLGLTGVSDSELVHAAEQAGLIDMINTHPLGFEMPVGERGDTLSGGQRQAVGLARVFLRSPPVLLLDEPTSAMDQGSENRLKARIQDFGQDRTVLLITHKMSMLNLVNRLVILDKGRVVADGPRDEVLEALRKGSIRGAL